MKKKKAVANIIAKWFGPGLISLSQKNRGQFAHMKALWTMLEVNYIFYDARGHRIIINNPKKALRGMQQGLMLTKVDGWDRFEWEKEFRIEL